MRLPRLTRRDWHGDSVVVVACGMALLASMALPWANTGSERRPSFTYGLSRPDGVKSVLFTEWGPPILVLGIAVIVLGSLMLALGPRRRTTQPIALVLAIASLGILYQTGVAMHALYGWGYAAGLGVLVALIVGIVLPVIALASAMTGRIVYTAESRARERLVRGSDASETSARLAGPTTLTARRRAGRGRCARG